MTSTSTARPPRTRPDTADFQDYVTRVAWGDIWSRPGLDRRARSIVVLSALMSRGLLGRGADAPARGADATALTREELREIILQVGLYCGVPAANHGVALLRDLES